MALAKRFKAVPVLVILGGALACGQSANTAATAEVDRDADVSEIRALLEQNEAAVNEQNPTDAAATYTPDGDIWVANGPRVAGTAELREHFERAHPSADEEVDLTVDDVRFLSSDVAIVESTSIATLPGGGTVARATLVVVRHGGSWKIAAARVMSIEESP